MTAALCDLPAKVTSLPQLKIVDPPKKCGKVAYPISTFTYVVVPTSSGDKAADLRKFVYWAVTAGQKFGPPLFFVPASEGGERLQLPRDQEDPGRIVGRRSAS